MAEYDFQGSIDFGDGRIPGAATITYTPEPDSGLGVVQMNLRLSGIVLVEGENATEGTIEFKLHINAASPGGFWARTMIPLLDGGVNLPLNFDMPVPGPGTYAVDVYIADAKLLRHEVTV